MLGADIPAWEVPVCALLDADGISRCAGVGIQAASEHCAVME